MQHARPVPAALRRICDLHGAIDFGWGRVHDLPDPALGRGVDDVVGFRAFGRHEDAVEIVLGAQALAPSLVLWSWSGLLSHRLWGLERFTPPADGAGFRDPERIVDFRSFSRQTGQMSQGGHLTSQPGILPPDWAKLMPSAPLLSSDTLGWESIALYRFRNPKRWQMQQPPLAWHFIAAHLLNPSKLSMRLNGRWQRGRTSPGEVIIMAAAARECLGVGRRDRRDPSVPRSRGSGCRRRGDVRPAGGAGQ